MDDAKSTLDEIKLYSLKGWTWNEFLLYFPHTMYNKCLHKCWVECCTFNVNNPLKYIFSLILGCEIFQFFKLTHNVMGLALVIDIHFFQSDIWGHFVRGIFCHCRGIYPFFCLMDSWDLLFCWIIACFYCKCQFCNLFGYLKGWNCKKNSIITEIEILLFIYRGNTVNFTKI